MLKVELRIARPIGLKNQFDCLGQCTGFGVQVVERREQHIRHLQAVIGAQAGYFCLLHMGVGAILPDVLVVVGNGNGRYEG